MSSDRISGTIPAAAMAGDPKVPFPELMPALAARTPARKTGPLPGPASLEAMPHLVDKLTALWKSRELNTFVHRLIMDSRDGSRQGLPVEVAEELLFLTKINRLVRAQESAPLLQITLGEALELIDRGDRAAALHDLPPDDVWGIAGRHPRNRSATPHRPPQGDRRDRHHEAGRYHRSLHHGAQQPGHRLLENPPLPDTVRIDVSAPRAMRGEGEGEHGHATMDWGLFRCLAKEACCLGIKRLEIADLGATNTCSWLHAGVRFAKKQCRFGQVVVHIDALAANPDLLADVMADGLDHLVLDFNMASRLWRTRAINLLAVDRALFRQLVERLLAYRDRIAADGGHRCLISLDRTGQAHGMLLQAAFRECASLAGVSRHTPAHGTAPAKLHCWAPFTVAHVRTNGHLVACAQDHSGYSFMADLKQEKLADAWSNLPFRKVRQRALCGEKPGRQCDICSHRAHAKGPAAS